MYRGPWIKSEAEKKMLLKIDEICIKFRFQLSVIYLYHLEGEVEKYIVKNIRY